MPVGTRKVVALILIIFRASIAHGEMPPIEFPEGQTEVRIPLQRGGSYLLVPVRINGKDLGPFILDTGASISMIDRKLAAELRLEAATFPGGFAGRADLKGERYALDSLEVGSVKARELFVMATDLGSFHNPSVNFPVKGILGMDFVLARMPFTINWQEAQLTLYKDKLPDIPGATRLRLLGNVAAPMVDALIEGRIATPVVIDTGNNGGWDLQYEVFDRHREWLLSLPWQPLKVTNIAGLHDGRMVSISQASLGDVKTGASDLFFSTNRSASLGFSLVGQHVLKNFEISIDTRSSMAWLKPVPNGSMPAEWSRNDFDPKKPDAFGITPLMHAILLKDDAQVDRFLAAGSNLDARDMQGMTALHRACDNGDLATVRKLLDAGATIAPRDGLERTPLQLAAGSGAIDVVKFLLAKGVDINADDATGQTSLIAAAEGGSSEMIELLIGAGADLNVVSARTGSAINTAAESGRTEAFKALLKAGADLYRTDRKRTPLLVSAADGGSTEIVQLLLERKLPVNSPDGGGRSPLIAAARTSNLDLARLLLKHGADPGAFDTNKLRAIEHARASPRQAEMIHLLYFEPKGISTTQP